MSAGLFEPLLRYLSSGPRLPQPPETQGGNLSRWLPRSLGAELHDWAKRDGGVVSGVAVRVAVPSLVWLLAVAAAVAVVAVLRRSGASRRSWRGRCQARPRIRCGLAIAATVGALAAAGIFGQVSHRQLALLAKDDGSQSGGGGAQASVAELIAAAEALLTRSVRLANATLAGLCSDAAPRLRGLLAAFAARLAAGLSGDARLTPLLGGLDEFVAAVQRLVAAMTAVTASRGGVAEELVTLKALADDIRTRTLPALESVCAELGQSCGDLGAQLRQLVVRPRASRLDADASVTAVTLLDRVFRLNVTELGHRVQLAHSAIAAALGAVDGPARQLVTGLSEAASAGTQRGLDAIAELSGSAHGAVRGREAAAAVGGMRTVTVVVLSALCASILLNIAALVSLLLLGRPKCQREGDEKQRRRSVAVTATVASCAAALLTGLFLAGAGAAAVAAAAKAEGCAPLTTRDGRRALTDRLDEFLDAAAWPKLQQLAARVPAIRLGLKPPQRVFESLLAGCGRNRTLAQALRLNLSQLVDTDRLLDSSVVSGQLAGVKAQLKKQLLNGAAHALVPSAEVSSVLGSLAQFAAVLDPVDYSASISELAQPLFQLDNASLAVLPDLLAQLGRQVLARSATDPRGFRLAMEADRLRSLVSDRVPPVSAGLVGLRRHFQTLQGHRTLGRLTAGLAARLVDFNAGLAGLSAAGIDRRFDEAFNATRPEAADLLADLLGRALAEVGRCDGLPELVGRVGELCQGAAECVQRWGGWLLAACVCWLLALALAGVGLHPAAASTAASEAAAPDDRTDAEAFL